MQLNSALTFLKKQGIGICDIVAHAYREKVDASDLGMQAIVLRDLIEILEGHPKVNTLLFTGGNSKNGPEYLFRKLSKKYGVPLLETHSEVPRQHQFLHPKTNKMITTVSLTAPSGSANRAVGSMALYKELKQKYPEMTTIDFRVLQYKDYF